jgi:hypothetical protein
MKGDQFQETQGTVQQWAFVNTEFLDELSNYPFYILASQLCEQYVTLTYR